MQKITLGIQNAHIWSGLKGLSIAVQPAEPPRLALCSCAMVLGQSISLTKFLCIVTNSLIVIHVFVCVYLDTGEDAALSETCMRKDLL